MTIESVTALTSIVNSGIQLYGTMSAADQAYDAVQSGVAGNRILADMAFESRRLQSNALLTEGILSNAAFQTEATLVQMQTALSIQDQMELAEYAIKDGKKFEQKQRIAFLKNGVELIGTPVMVLQETIDESLKGVQSLVDKAAGINQLGELKVQQLRSSGRAALVGSKVQAAQNDFNAIMEKASALIRGGVATQSALADRSATELGGILRFSSQAIDIASSFNTSDRGNPPRGTLISLPTEQNTALEGG